MELESLFLGHDFSPSAETFTTEPTHNLRSHNEQKDHDVYKVDEETVRLDDTDVDNMAVDFDNDIVILESHSQIVVPKENIFPEGEADATKSENDFYDLEGVSTTGDMELINEFCGVSADSEAAALTKTQALQPEPENEDHVGLNDQTRYYDARSHNRVDIDDDLIDEFCGSAASSQFEAFVQKVEHQQQIYSETNANFSDSDNGKVEAEADDSEQNDVYDDVINEFCNIDDSDQFLAAIQNQASDHEDATNGHVCLSSDACANDGATLKGVIDTSDDTDLDVIREFFYVSSDKHKPNKSESLNHGGDDKGFYTTEEGCGKLSDAGDNHEICIDNNVNMDICNASKPDASHVECAFGNETAEMTCSFEEVVVENGCEIVSDFAANTEGCQVHVEDSATASSGHCEKPKKTLMMNNSALLLRDRQIVSTGNTVTGSYKEHTVFNANIDSTCHSTAQANTVNSSYKEHILLNAIADSTNHSNAYANTVTSSYKEPAPLNANADSTSRSTAHANTVTSSYKEYILLNANADSTNHNTAHANTVTSSYKEHIILNANADSASRNTAHVNNVTSSYKEHILLNANADSSNHSRVHANSVNSSYKEHVLLNANADSTGHSTSYANIATSSYKKRILLNSNIDSTCHSTVHANTVTNSYKEHILCNANTDSACYTTANANTTTSSYKKHIPFNSNADSTCHTTAHAKTTASSYKKHVLLSRNIDSICHSSCHRTCQSTHERPKNKTHTKEANNSLRTKSSPKRSTIVHRKGNIRKLNPEKVGYKEKSPRSRCGPAGSRTATPYLIACLTDRNSEYTL
ncbi:hypothetical protein PoB_002656500 [Plakobranchus ocellatus]|uniref:Uncharacterized protein n=1 Tax=Plakobranchus ocellatus TaxID=259542 RepID=A0AAV3ZZG5_9GAST|nr:hypothetical protein PoB_002656500 [Plakobranchus ocellatus]